jgi:flagellar biosynthesis protein
VLWGSFGAKHVANHEDQSKKPGLTARDDAVTDGTTDETAPAKRPVAVALQYEPDHDNAPRVVAGGRGTIAEQILQIAFAQGIKVRADPDLAELLTVIDIDSEIPTEAFAAVAEILIYVYRANGISLPFENESPAVQDAAP